MRQTKWMALVLCTFIVILCLSVPALAAKKRPSQKRKPSLKKRNPVAENLLVNEMLRHLGAQYQRGGSSPGAVDCSGYVRLVYQNACGLTLPHQSASLYHLSDLQKVPLDDLKTGDLLFFSSSRQSRRIDHVGMYLSEGRFIHATRGKGVIVSSLDQQYYSDRVAGARRVLGQSSLRDAPSSDAPGVSRGTLFDHRKMGADLSVVSHSLGLEIGQNKDFQVSLFQDSLFSRNETDSEYAPRDGPTGVGHALSSHVLGIRFERDIRSFPWLVLTPSLSYFDYEGDLNETGLPKRSVGLDLSLSSNKADTWRISTGVRYLSLISPNGYAKEERAPQGIDVSLSYSRRILDGLTISLVGERLQRFKATVDELPQQERILEDQRFSVIFNFSY